MADAAADLGFDGVDLTVRPKGHVLPENVNEDLPKAVEAIKKAGLRHEMMVSNVTDPNNDLDRSVLKTASEYGIAYYRMGYLSFVDALSIPERLKKLNKQMHDLAQLNESLKIQGGYQNHSGKRIGAQIWDLWHLLKGINPSVLGVQYDIRHGVVEGGASWENGIRLIAPQINSLVLKDFIWEKNNSGKWKIKNVPLGEGMVDFPAYFQIIKALKLVVPFTIHYEYDLGGVEHGTKDSPKIPVKEVLKAMKKDLIYAKRIWDTA